MSISNWGQLLTNLIHKGLSRKPLNSSTEIRLTRLCTQRCRQCSVYERTTEPPTMSWKKFTSIAQKLRTYGAYIGFISGGEATLVPDLDKILLEAKKTFLLSTTLVTGLYNKTAIIEKIGQLALDHDIHIQTSLDGLDDLGDNLRGVRNFSRTVLKHMEWLSKHRDHSKSILYANIVINNKNLDQVSEITQRINDVGWKTTIGVYHTLTRTTRFDRELKLRPNKRLNQVIEYLYNHPNIMNLNTFILGIHDYIKNKHPQFCPFVDAPVLTTRTTIMEDGTIHLCYGDSIGDLLQTSLANIFDSESYRNRLTEYAQCRGCWTTCYTQRYLLTHPKSFREFLHNIQKLRNLKPKETPNHHT